MTPKEFSELLLSAIKWSKQPEVSKVIDRVLYVFINWFIFPMVVMFFLQKFGVKGLISKYFRAIGWVITAPFKLIAWLFRVVFGKTSNKNMLLKK